MKRKQRTERLSVRLRPDEKEKLKKVSDKLDITVTELIVKLIEESYEKVVEKEGD